MSKVKHYLPILIVAIALLASQLACDEGQAPQASQAVKAIKSVNVTGCKSTACRNSCNGDTNCQIECCNGTRIGWNY